MIRANFKMLALGLLVSTAVSLTSCKSKPKETESTIDTTTAISPAPTPTAPVEIAPDDELTTGLKDATKDYPGVNATASNGEITLTGEIERSKLPDLMQTLNTLKPKKINNQLTIK